MGDRPTIHDVARHAGVGAKTVSRVINGERAVSDAMRARVTASVRALNYHPNGAARVLRKKVTSSIGFVCEDIAEPVQAQLARAIEAVTSKNDAAMTVSVTHHDRRREQAVIESLVSRQVDGLVLWPTGTGSHYLERLVSTLPVVCVDRPIDGVDTDTVLCENGRGATVAVETLLEAGHTRLAFVGDQPDLFTQRERLAGYQSGLINNGFAFDPQIVFQQEQRIPALRKQLAYWQAVVQPPTAIFAASSLATTALVRALAATSPIHVLGFDDFPLADVVRGGISVIRQDIDTIGTTAAETLFGRLSGAPRGTTQARIPATLVRRR